MMEPAIEDLQAELGDGLWLLIADLFANPAPGPRCGRPVADPRGCFEGLVWILRSGGRQVLRSPVGGAGAQSKRRRVLREALGLPRAEQGYHPEAQGGCVTSCMLRGLPATWT
ncbi:MAG: hypothetical protein AAGA92_03810 [Planctomycetota bacterium]